jgi:hypothetical protein
MMRGLREGFGGSRVDKRLQRALTRCRQHQPVALVGSATCSGKFNSIYSDQTAADQMIEHARGFSI